MTTARSWLSNMGFREALLWMLDGSSRTEHREGVPLSEVRLLRALP